MVRRPLAGLTAGPVRQGHRSPAGLVTLEQDRSALRVRVQLIGDFEACMTEIYLHIDARMADYIRTHP